MKNEDVDMIFAQYEQYSAVPEEIKLTIKAAESSNRNGKILIIPQHKMV
jgi:hypothetical protein